MEKNAKFGNVGMAVGTIYHSELEAKFYAASLVDVVTTGVIYDTHILRHCFTRAKSPRVISSLGFVTGSMLDKNDVFEADTESVSKLLDVFEFLSNQ